MVALYSRCKLDLEIGTVFLYILTLGRCLSALESYGLWADKCIQRPQANIGCDIKIAM